VASWRRFLGGGLLAGVLGLALVAAPSPSFAEGGHQKAAAHRTKKKKKKSARVAKKSTARRSESSEDWRPPRSCRPQKAKSFLVRGNFMKNGMLLPAKHQKAVRWRAEHYGFVPGLESYASESAISQAVSVKFMGLPIRVHKKIAPKLRCVERMIKRTCKSKKQRYVPKAIGGFREQNSYRQGEVSNHLFGIAIDIDPDRNPCCGCVDPWPDHPACKTDEKSPFAKSELPSCWVRAFEHYGFYWLGRDKLQDTMHFEFLGDPDR